MRFGKLPDLFNAVISRGSLFTADWPDAVQIGAENTAALVILQPIFDLAG
jgi:hypothetical protein